MTDDAPTVRLGRTRIRPTRRGVLLALLGVFLYAAGANVAAGWVLVLAAACLGALPWAWWSARRAAGRIDVQRALPARATAGVATEVGLRVVAPTPAAAVVCDELTQAVGALRGLAAGATLQAPARLPRGWSVGGDVTVELADPLGLVSAHARGTVGGRCLVVPAIPRVEAGETALHWAGALDGRAQRAGDGAEVLGVRDYRSGDPLRSVHWRSTARTGQLVVREFADDARPTVAVELAGGTWTVPTLDLAATAACGLADAFAALGHPVQLGMDGTTLAWGDAARVQLATLPPTPATSARQLAAAPQRPADLVLILTPGTAGAQVAQAVGVTAVGGGRVRDLGEVPVDVVDVGAWLTVRLANLGTGA